MHFEKYFGIIEHGFIIKIKMREIPLILYYLMVGILWLFALAWIVSHFDKEKDNVQSNNDKEKKDKLWRIFEKNIADCFAQRGWEKKLWPWEIDDWKDIVIRKNWKIYLIQCKRWFWKLWVQSQQIREFQWSIDYYKKKYDKDAQWIFITTWFTSQRARDTADLLWIHLWDKYNWKSRVNTFEW